MVSKPINLNQARKARKKVQKRAQADDNAVTFGLTKAQKAQAKAAADKARRALDQHRRDEDPRE